MFTDQQCWDIFFAGLVSIQFHPANEHNQKDIDKIIQRCGVVADLMMRERSKRCPG